MSSALPEKYAQKLMEEAIGLEISNIMALAIFLRSLSPHLTIKEVFEKMNDADYLFEVIAEIEGWLDEQERKEMGLL